MNDEEILNKVLEERWHLYVYDLFEKSNIVDDFYDSEKVARDELEIFTDSIRKDAYEWELKKKPLLNKNAIKEAIELARKDERRKTETKIGIKLLEEFAIDTVPSDVIEINDLIKYIKKDIQDRIQNEVNNPDKIEGGETG